MAQTDFNTTYLAMQDRIYRLAVSIMGNRVEAEDIVQDLYERLWNRRLLMAGSKNPEGYILTAARNMSLDRIRQRRPTSEVTAQLVSSEGSTGEDAADLAEIMGRLVKALPEKQRTAVHLRDVECMEIEQIAKVMNIKETAVRMSLSRARSTVKEQMIKIMSYGI
jgi:RNA polymerase sigma-70 factor (ECF subfamily)